MRFFKDTTFLFIAMIVFGGLFSYWLWDNYQTRSVDILNVEQESVKNQYESTINSYRLVSKTLYDEVLNTPEIVNILDQAAVAGSGEQAVLRQRLQQKLTPVYNRLQARNFKQLHFYLPDTTSFLSMQRPDYFGEKLGDVRYSVKMVSENHRYVEGFEEGKSFNGFMFVFPLFKGDRYVGSVETSVSLNTFRQEMSLIFPYVYNFIIKKQVLNDRIFADEERNYYISDVSRDYFHETEKDNIRRVDIVSPVLISKVNTRFKLKKETAALIGAGQSFTKSITMDKIELLVTFLPIKNIKGEQVAYLLAYHPDENMSSLVNDLILKYVFVMSLIFAMLFFIYYINDSQEKLLDTNEKLKNIASAMGEGLMVINNDYEVVFFNEAAEKITGFGVAEILNHEYWRVLKFVRENDDTRNDDFIKYVFKFNDIKTDSQHIYLIQKDRDKIPLAVSAAPLRSQDDDILGCIVVFRDITQEKEVDKAKSEFVSLASHQLKTPLSAVSWYAELLTDGEAGPLNNKQKDFVKEIHEGNQRMIRLINGLLNVSRIDMGTLSVSPEPVDVEEVADSVLSELQFGIKAKNLRLIKEYAPRLPKLNLDLSLARVALQNILSNAVKYSREDGQVKIIIKQINNRDLYIAVEDNGYGIPKKQQPSIFKKLFRADNVKSLKVEGTGLGLYVAKAVVEAFGGKIWFKSEENKGTTFFITLPLAGTKPKAGTKGLEMSGVA